MKTFVHTFNTWFVALLLQPVVFIIYFLLVNAAAGTEWGAGVVFIFVFSFFASVPSLLIAWLLLHAIVNTGFSPSEKLIAWITSVVVAIFLNFAVLNLLLGFEIGNEINELIPSPIIAAVLSILIRHRQFFAFHLNYNSIKNENNVA